MAERLGLGLIPGAGWRATEIRAIAGEAEDAGFDAIVAAEVNNDALATALLMGMVTRQIQVGTWIASIHMRHSYACAKAADLIADATGGRMILGLGMSHQPVNAALGAEMPSPVAALRAYTTEVTAWLRGQGPTTHLPQQPAPVPVPIYLAAMTSPTVELAGELADGVMPFMWSAARVTRSKAWAARGRAKVPDRAPLDMALGIPTFIGDDIEQMRNIARANLALFTTFPFYQRMFRASGFTEEAAKAEASAGGASLSDRMLDAICLIGPLSRCRE
jgi:alkanesulfonate monooxygenase SsuD/methylene tetrahydromethanopterin reductase-like flavin-dependent oxidoreductase (luciferase family)